MSDTIKSLTDATRLTFEQVLASYRNRPAMPETPVAPAVAPPPAKPIHLLTDDELRRGVLACGNCQGLGYYRVNVAITDERFGKLLDCPDCLPFKSELRRREQFVRLIPRIAPYSLLRGDLLTREFSNFDRSLTENDDGSNPYDVARTWALAVIGKAVAPPWAYICGDSGNGKTHLLAAAANGLTRANVPLIFATMPDTLAMILDAPMEMRETFVKYLQTVPALLLDDFGTEKPTDWKVETTFRIINWRYTERRPTLFSSNTPPSYLPEMRVSSRICDTEICAMVFNHAPDYRPRSADQRRKP